MSIALSDVALAVVGALGHIGEAQINGEERARYGNDLYGAFGAEFSTADGCRLYAVAISPRQWRSLLEATGTEGRDRRDRAPSGPRFHRRGRSPSEPGQRSRRPFSAGSASGRGPTSGSDSTSSESAGGRTSPSGSWSATIPAARSTTSCSESSTTPASAPISCPGRRLHSMASCRWNRPLRPSWGPTPTRSSERYSG